MGFKDDVRAKATEFEMDINALKERVSALESLARQFRAGAPATTIGNAAGRRRSTLDYGAVAFGLSEYGRKMQSLTTMDVSDYHAPAVQFFADVFAKADPAFDAEGFKRAAGV